MTEHSLWSSVSQTGHNPIPTFMPKAQGRLRAPEAIGPPTIGSEETLDLSNKLSLLMVCPEVGRQGRGGGRVEDHWDQET